MTMVIARSVEEWKARFGAGVETRRSVVTIGNFDGVHRGHQEILRGVIARARQNGGLATVVTFDPHPLRVLRPEKAPLMLMSLEQRLQMFAEMGLDAALVLKFDQAFSQISPEDFVRGILAETLHAKAILLGENFRFGHRHAGDVRLLKDMGRALDFEVVIMPPVTFRGEIVSSTAVREALREGRASRAGRLLGRPYNLQGTVQHGAGIGGKLVVPTLNLSTDAEILPKIGVYVTETSASGWWYRSVTNVGRRPTFETDGSVSVESFLFDFDGRAVEGSMDVRFWARLRDERKFSGPEELRAQIQRDASCAQQFFRLLTARRRRPNSLPA